MTLLSLCSFAASYSRLALYTAAIAKETPRERLYRTLQESVAIGRPDYSRKRTAGRSRRRLWQFAIEDKPVESDERLIVLPNGLIAVSECLRMAQHSIRMRDSETFAT